MPKQVSVTQALSNTLLAIVDRLERIELELVSLNSSRVGTQAELATLTECVVDMKSDLKACKTTLTTYRTAPRIEDKPRPSVKTVAKPGRK